MKVAFYTLGCKVNAYETEVMKELFEKAKYQVTDIFSAPDIIVINTCTVTNNADQKSRKMINRLKRENKKAIIVVCGCLPVVNEDKIKDLQIDILIGNQNKSKIVDFVEKFKKTKKPIKDIIKSNKEFENMCLTNYETKTRAIVKIQEGCDNFCSYCIIPFSRGPLRSKKIEDVIKEVKNLVRVGHQEIVLTGIHTGKYGKGEDYDLSDLLIKLEEIENLKRIRISSIEINEITPKLLKVAKESQKVANHFHIPLQSGTNSTLKAMNRKYDTKYFKKQIKSIRKNIKDVSITTDVIVGFPGESDQDFEKTVKFIKKIAFTKLHVFPFSERKGTKAATMPNKVDEKTKKERVNKLLELSLKLENKFYKKFINKELTIIPETKKDGMIKGHTTNYIEINIPSNVDLIHEEVRIKIIGVNETKVEGRFTF